MGPLSPTEYARLSQVIAEFSPRKLFQPEARRQPTAPARVHRLRDRVHARLMPTTSLTTLELAAVKVLIVGSWRDASMRLPGSSIPSARCRTSSARPAMPGIATTVRTRRDRRRRYRRRCSDFAERERIDLTVVGPELPLDRGIADPVRARGTSVIFGPSRAAAQLECSKAFAKAFMARHGIPTARYRVLRRRRDRVRSDCVG